MGVEDKYFVTPPSEHFRCPICRDVAYPPVKTRCDHVFCQPCLNEWLSRADNSNPTCPVDRKALSHQVKKDTFLTRVINDLKVKCVFFEKGCNWQGTLESRESHTENECMFTMASCPFKNCKETVIRKDLESHKRTCRWRNVSCKYCNQQVPFNYLNEENHYKECPKYPIKCEFCNADIILQNKQKHLDEECPVAEMECTFNGCQARFKRKEFKNHINKNLVEHILYLQKQCTELHDENKKLRKENDQLREQVTKLNDLETYTKRTFLFKHITVRNYWKELQREFEAEGMIWFVSVCPNSEEDNEEDGYVSLVLGSGETISPKVRVRAVAHLPQGKTIEKVMECDLSDENPVVGWPRFVSHNELGWSFEDVSHSYNLKITLYVKVLA